MRQTALAAALSLLVAVGVAAPAVGLVSPARADGTGAGPKVVIIVGATEGTTSTYRSYADLEYTEALKFTSNVVKVYSPDATWAAVQAAVAGASIVIYHGHGNGWPSPYPYDSAFRTRDGFGLNGTAGAGDSNRVYYGEPYISTLHFAPNAVILLHNLCYASGNSEPGYPQPTVDVAQQRVDNYGAAFLKAGAGAVIADGHSGAEYYLDALLSTHQTIDQLWRAAPNFHGNVVTFASTRTPGATAEMDPDVPGSDYYRSVVGRLDLTTDAVTGAATGGPGTTGGDPATFAVPGAASVNGSATVFADAALTSGAVATLPAGTRLRLDAQAGTGPDGAPIFRMHTLDGAVTGFVSGASLVPRDSVGPALDSFEAGPAAISPNGDGVNDSFSMTGQLTEAASWRVRIRNAAGLVVAEATGAGPGVAVGWDGRIGALPAPDGTYRWDLRAEDGWGNAALVRSGTVIVDTVAPSFTSPISLAASSGPVTISPNGHGIAAALSVGYTLSEPARVDVRVADAFGLPVRTVGASTALRRGTATWDGRIDSGAPAPDGLYTVMLTPRDAAGNVGAARSIPVAVYADLAEVAPSAAVFFPQDADALAPSTTLGFTLTAPATVSWTIAGPTGAVVLAPYVGAPLGSGPYSLTWDGRDATGAVVAPGTYTSIVTATNGTVGATIRQTLTVDAFRITASTSTPRRGQRVTVTVVSAEPLSAVPRLRISQPGLAAWSVVLSPAGGSTYRATFTLRWGGGSGTLRLTATGVDTAGGSNASALALPLH